MPEQLVCVPRTEAAQLFSSYAEAPLLRAQVATLQNDLATKDRIIAAQGQLLELADKLTAGEKRLRALAEEEAGVYRGRAERVQADAEKSTRWLRCRANGGAGALAGLAAGSIVPGAGNGAGLVIGAIIGCVAGLLGAP